MNITVFEIRLPITIKRGFLEVLKHFGFIHNLIRNSYSHKHVNLKNCAIGSLTFCESVPCYCWRRHFESIFYFVISKHRNKYRFWVNSKVNEIKYAILLSVLFQKFIFNSKKYINFDFLRNFTDYLRDRSGIYRDLS